MPDENQSLLNVSGKEVIAIIMGASEWPMFEKLNFIEGDFASNPFVNSKNFFAEYLLSANGLGIPKENLLDLFDNADSPYKIKQLIEAFLLSSKMRIGNISDVIFYYVGHGDYYEKDNYYIATKFLDQSDIKSTRFDIEDIASKLLDNVGSSRHILILDSCYSAGAQSAYRQSIENAAESVNELTQKYRPRLGTTLFCAAGQRKYAKVLPGQEMTMFTGALSEALKNHTDTENTLFSLRELGEEMQDIIREKYGSEGVIPEIHTPIADDGDIASSQIYPRFFPKPSLNEIDILRRKVDKLTIQLEVLEISNIKNTRLIGETVSEATINSAAIEKIKKELEENTIVGNITDDNSGIYSPERTIKYWDDLDTTDKEIVLNYLSARRKGIFLITLAVVVFICMSTLQITGVIIVDVNLLNLGTSEFFSPTTGDENLVSWALPAGRILLIFSFCWVLITYSHLLMDAFIISPRFKKRAVANNHSDIEPSDPIHLRSTNTRLIAILGITFTRSSVLMSDFILVISIIITVIKF
ncbi:MAG: caspase family protein [Roseibium sp.]